MLKDWQEIVWIIAVAAGAIIASVIASYLLFKVLRRISQRNASALEGSIERHCKKAIQWTIMVMFVRVALSVYVVAGKAGEEIDHLLGLLLMGFVSWLIIKTVYVLEDTVFIRLGVEKDSYKARKIRTQTTLLKQIAIVVIGVLAFGTMLMTFPHVRELGQTILTSAGILGLVIGVAAQKTIGTFIAGLQIAFTQPIRLDDVVVVEGESGLVEEITLTYVVVKIWDLRRLVIPITYFIEKPFQNWTRTASDLLGAVKIYVDYTMPIEALREELKRILEGSKFWDKKTGLLKVTNMTERVVELQAVVSAANDSDIGSLQSEVRERLIVFIQQNYPESLPRVRTEMRKEDEGRDNKRQP